LLLLASNTSEDLPDSGTGLLDVRIEMTSPDRRHEVQQKF